MVSGHPTPRSEGAGAEGRSPAGSDSMVCIGPADKAAHPAPSATAVSRIRVRRDFLAANAGVRVPSTSFVLLVKPTDRGETRSGFTVSKKIGNAVARNRARRRLREATRIAMAEAGVAGADHVFIARRLDAERPFADIVHEARKALAKAGRKLDQRA